MESKRECVKLIQAWCAKNGKKLVSKPRHIFPRSFVVAQLAERCLIIARPWMDCEPQLLGWEHHRPMESVRVFDPRLKVGDWCITAYIRTEGSGEPMAIPVPSWLDQQTSKGPKATTRSGLRTSRPTAWLKR